MANRFRSISDFVQSMCDDFKFFTGVTLDPQNFNDERVAKFYPMAGALSLLTAEIQQVEDNFFPQSADSSALPKHLKARALQDQIQPQKSVGYITFTGTDGSVIPVGAQITRVSDGAGFTTLTNGTITGSSVSIQCQSVDTGNDQNLDLLGQSFTLITKVTGVNAACTNSTLFTDGRDLESSTEMLTRIEAHDKDDNSGGNLAAYEAWALASSPDVVSAKAVKNPRGAGTVNVIITSGTTDITNAVNQGQSVVRQPSASLIQTVQTYINQLDPTTDDALVVAPAEIVFPVTLSYSLYTDTPANRSAVDTQITKIIQIFVYSAKSLQTLTPTALERAIDNLLSDQVKERTVSNFSSSQPSYTVPAGSILTPGVITLNQG